VTSPELTAARLRRDARAIFHAAVDAANPFAAVETALRRHNWNRYDRIFAVGAGKAGGTMARAAERVLGSRIAAGCVAVKDNDATKCRHILIRPCGHPVPDRRGVAAARTIAGLCAEAGPRDLVLCMLSGGASALLPAPAPGITLTEKKATTKLLLESGATIHQINAVRKHLSALKGGRLTKISAPAHVLTLALSDVIGDRPDVIGSGPTAPDSSTFADALAVLDRFHLGAKVPASVRRTLEQGAEETPKPGDPVFNNAEYQIIGSNNQSLEAAAKKARALGYRTLILAGAIEGETRDVARMHAAIARRIREHNQPLRPPACVISGGETTVTIGGKGKGGRNQEFALAAAIDIAGLKNTLILSAGTDGTDGPTDAAGAFAYGDTCRRAEPRDPTQSLAQNDSYPFFKSLGDLLITGSTGTNVMDLHLILVGK
jgi:hydroxypyruvate reductase